MRYWLLAILFLVSITSTDAQFGNWGGGKSKLKGKITGQVIDTISGEAVGFASISISKAGKTKVINGVLSEDNGKFKIPDVKEGKYDLVVSFLGYEDKKIDTIKLTGKAPRQRLSYWIKSKYLPSVH